MSEAQATPKKRSSAEMKSAEMISEESTTKSKKLQDPYTENEPPEKRTATGIDDSGEREGESQSSAVANARTATGIMHRQWQLFDLRDEAMARAMAAGMSPEIFLRLWDEEEDELDNGGLSQYGGPVRGMSVHAQFG